MGKVGVDAGADFGMGGEEGGFRARQLALAGFFAETVLATAPGRVSGITQGGDSFLDNSEALFGIA